LVYWKTHLEEYIEALYKKVGVEELGHLSLSEIGMRLGIKVKEHSESSTCLQIGSVSFILLNRELTEQQKRQEFAHELCHFLRHAGNQTDLSFPFVQLQEWQANTFALHFCIPTFMIEKLDLTDHKQAASAEIAQTFGVEYDFAEERLERWLLQRAMVYYG
jgi:Zn-dependent peptidase ImmA (M78 family)